VRVHLAFVDKALAFVDHAAGCSAIFANGLLTSTP
jgi:hypothetical protein